MNLNIDNKMNGYIRIKISFEDFPVIKYVTMILVV